MISIKEVEASYPDWKLLEDDKQVHVNHVGCPAGEDRKRRLYIMKDGYKWLFYCHHCGDKGFYFKDGPGRVTEGAYENSSLSKSLACDSYDISELKPSSSDYTEEQILWLGHSFEVAKANKVYPFNSDLYIPVLHDNLVTAILMRHFREGSKYVLYETKDFDGLAYKTPNLAKSPLVIVEDCLSCYRLASHNINSVALLGTKNKEALYKFISHNGPKFSNIVLWLDNDVAGNDGSVSLMKDLYLFPIPTTCIVDDEPKRLTDERLKEYGASLSKGV